MEIIRQGDDKSDLQAVWRERGPAYASWGPQQRQNPRHETPEDEQSRGRKPFKQRPHKFHFQFEGILQVRQQPC